MTMTTSSNTTADPTTTNRMDLNNDTMMAIQDPAEGLSAQSQPPGSTAVVVFTTAKTATTTTAAAMASHDGSRDDQSDCNADDNTGTKNGTGQGLDFRTHGGALSVAMDADPNDKDIGAGQLALKRNMEAYKAGKIDRPKFLEETVSLLVHQADELFLHPVKRVYLELDEAKVQVKSLKETTAAKDRELDRLRESDRKKNESIQKLIKAIGTSNEHQRDDSQTKLVEAKMRAETLQVTTERDANAAALNDANRRIQVLESELQSTKAKNKKLVTEKIAIDRDYRTLKSQVTRFQGTDTNDVEYFKKQYEQQKVRLQTQQSLLDDKDQTIANLKRDRDRHLSQNVLASMRANDNNGAPSIKKSRHSF